MSVAPKDDTYAYKFALKLSRPISVKYCFQKAISCCYGVLQGLSALNTRTSKKPMHSKIAKELTVKLLPMSSFSQFFILKLIFLIICFFSHLQILPYYEMGVALNKPMLFEKSMNQLLLTI